MGGDIGPRLCVAAGVSFLSQHPSTSITFVGDQTEIDTCLKRQGNSVVGTGRIRIVHTTDIVDTAEKAGIALRHKRSSSMWKSLELLGNGEVDACVSGGNTGALMAMSRHLIGTFADINRPAICKLIPTAKNSSLLLDLGANLECSAAQLVQFAVMGSSLAKVGGKQHPKVALLNVGSEITKGSEAIQEAASLMRAHPAIEFGGFVEGNKLYSGDFDVIVCDGFVGNVALKVSEGVAAFILDSLRKQMASNVIRKMAAVLIKPAMKSWSEQINPSRYNGAALLGLKKVVVKSHGGADAEGFHRALETAKEQIEANIPAKIENCLKL